MLRKFYIFIQFIKENRWIPMSPLNWTIHTFYRVERKFQMLVCCFDHAPTLFVSVWCFGFGEVHRNTYCASDRFYKGVQFEMRAGAKIEWTPTKERKRWKKTTRKNRIEKRQKETRTSQQFHAILNSVTVLLLHFVHTCNMCGMCAHTRILSLSLSLLQMRMKK